MSGAAPTAGAPHGRGRRSTPPWGAVPAVHVGGPPARAHRSEHLDEPLTVERLASRAAMSPRTFARRFQEVAGTTPHRWLLRQRVLHAQRLLETTDVPVERIASDVGFGSAAVLRQHFGRIVGTPPLAYRRTFEAGRASSSGEQAVLGVPGGEQDLAAVGFAVDAGHGSIVRSHRPAQRVAGTTAHARFLPVPARCAATPSSGFGVRRAASVGADPHTHTLQAPGRGATLP